MLQIQHVLRGCVCRPSLIANASLIVSIGSTFARHTAASMATEAARISAIPAAGQLIEHDGRTYNTIREGKAYILVPPHVRTSTDPKAKIKAGPSDNGKGSDVAQHVFYNPIQQFNRDLSVLAIAAFGQDLCDKKRVRHGKELAKNQRRKDKKRKQNGDASGECENERGPKLRKVADDSTAINTKPQSHQENEIDLRQERRVGVQEMSSERPRNTHNDQHTDIPQSAVHNGPNGTKTDTDLSQTSYKPSFRILDALSATGLRALRYASEIPDATSVIANDMDKNAVSSIRLNVQHNNLASIITPNHGNAMGVMYGAAFPPHDSHGPNHVSSKFDVVDLDPYGTAAPFIDSAIQSLNDGGLLCVTCTDSGVFASCGYSEKTFSLYGGVPVKGSHSHEAGLRIILHSIASSAARYGVAIEPLLSLSIDFYVRMFIRVRKSAADVKFLSGKTMIIYGCDTGCGAWTTQLIGRNTKMVGKTDDSLYKHSIAQAPNASRFCEHCGSKTHLAGPMWAGPIHNPSFIEKILSATDTADKEIYQTIPRIQGMLETALEELSVIDPVGKTSQTTKTHGEAVSSEIVKTSPEQLDLHPFFFMPAVLAKVIHCQSPPEAALKGALRHAGYRATRSHCKGGSIKTDAPWTAIWKIMREWVRQKSPVKEGAVKETAPGWKVLHPSVEDSSSIRAGAEEAFQDPAEIPKPEASIGDKDGTKKEHDSKASFKVVFDEALGKDQPRARKLVRYQQNPRENWGPMARAKGPSA